MGIQLNGSVIVTCPSLQSASPLHPSNVEAPSGIAVKVTGVPDAKLATHEGPQVIPAGLLVTVPLPVPVLVTVSVGGTSTGPTWTLSNILPMFPQL